MLRLQKILFSGLVWLTSVLCCGNLMAEDGSLALDSFEGTIGQQTVDFGAAAGSSLQVETATDEKSCGGRSLKMTYELEPGGYMFCARGQSLDVAGALWEGPAPDKINWSEYKAISFQMNDQSAVPGAVAFDIKDAGGEVWRFMINDGKGGWTKMTVPLDQFKVREDWQPSTADGNRKLDFPIKSYQWEPKTPGEGVIYFDCVQLEK